MNLIPSLKFFVILFNIPLQNIITHFTGILQSYLYILLHLYLHFTRINGFFASLCVLFHEFFAAGLSTLSVKVIHKLLCSTS